MKKYMYTEWQEIGDSFEKVFDTEQEAVDYGDMIWDKHLTEREKERLSFSVVFYGEVDECGYVDTNTAKVIKQYK